MQRFIYIFCLVLAFSDLSAQPLQNMVRNPSFEQYKDLPEDLGAIKQASFHSAATAAEGDYFHKRSKNLDVATPRSKMGRAMPRTGDAYAGFYAYTNRYVKRDFREYVQMQLKQPLLKGHEYCIRAHVYLTESSNRGLMGLGFSAQKGAIQQTHQTYLQTPFIWLLRQDKKPLIDRQWVEVSTIYKAQGGETHIIIGNFQSDKDTKITGAVEVDSFRNPNVDFAYYFLDDVCMTDLTFNFSCDCGTYDFIQTSQREKIVMDVRLKPVVYDLGQPTIMDGVEFEKGKAILLASSHYSLDELALYLNKNPHLSIEISGHTSDKGDAEENHFLSKRRAQSVYDYLRASGIAQERMTYRGYGQARPIVLNDSAENRARNERIQIILSQPTTSNK